MNLRQRLDNLRAFAEKAKAARWIGIEENDTFMVVAADILPALLDVVGAQHRALEKAGKALNAFGTGTEEIANVCAMSAEEFSLFLEGCKALDEDACEAVRAALALMDKEEV